VLRSAADHHARPDPTGAAVQPYRQVGGRQAVVVAQGVDHLFRLAPIERRLGLAALQQGLQQDQERGEDPLVRRLVDFLDYPAGADQERAAELRLVVLPGGDGLDHHLDEELPVAGRGALAFDLAGPAQGEEAPGQLAVGIGAGYAAPPGGRHVFRGGLEVALLPGEAAKQLVGADEVGIELQDLPAEVLRLIAVVAPEADQGTLYVGIRLVGRAVQGFAQGRVRLLQAPEGEVGLGELVPGQGRGGLQFRGLGEAGQRQVRLLHVPGQAALEQPRRGVVRVRAADLGAERRGLGQAAGGLQRIGAQQFRVHLGVVIHLRSSARSVGLKVGVLGGRRCHTLSPGLMASGDGEVLRLQSSVAQADSDGWETGAIPVCPLSRRDRPRRGWTRRE
jgi:hypothetical protein